MTVYFVDTSILCNILPVPGRDTDRDEVVRQLQQLVSNKTVLILPVTSLIETGNFVSQISDGNVRRTTAEKFQSLIGLVLAGRAPWQLHQFEWGEEFLQLLIDGGGTEVPLLDHFANGVGAGDLCILTERAMYQRRTGIKDVRVWSLDAKLSAHD